MHLEPNTYLSLLRPDCVRNQVQIPVRKEKRLCSVVLLDDLSSSPDETSSSSGNKTDLLTSGSVSSHGGWVTDMLLVTSSVRMLNWVHGNTSNSWPVLSLTLVLVPGSVSLKEWLIGSLTSGADSNHSSAVTHDGLSGSGWESDSCLSLIVGVTDDDSRGSRGSGERSSISDLALAVGNDGSFWHGVNWKDVSN